MTFTQSDIDTLKFDAAGLITSVICDADDGELLMVGWMNRESLRLTLERGRAVFWSRSREQLWEKGETSGNTLHVVDITVDCDRDTLRVRVKPAGPVCHTGSDTCFGARDMTSVGFLAELEHIVSTRMQSADPESYTVKLLAAGTRRIAQKVGEEGVEVALAATGGEPAELVSESADLLYHLIVLLKSQGLSLADVARELESRHSG